MEPEVHIVERYMQLVEGCFTMTNVMLKGGKELDLLAVNPISKEKYHIEVRVTIGKGFKLRMKDTQTRKGVKHRRGVDTLSKIKFEPQIVAEAAARLLGSEKYRKVLVVWAVEEEAVARKAKDEYHIEVWMMEDLIGKLARKVGTKAHRDDILRTVQLLSLR